MKFGTTPKMGNSEQVFSLEKLLQKRIENVIDSCTLFVDLVKARDSIAYEVVLTSLTKWELQTHT